jgi:hypothetical protein
MISVKFLRSAAWNCPNLASALAVAQTEPEVGLPGGQRLAGLRVLEVGLGHAGREPLRQSHHLGGDLGVR